ncbi:MAG: DUF4304 domain-containing protein [Planctomycetota bacterium]
MAENDKYVWDFDRPSMIEFYTKFSVRIYQWQQKASGKGLKKSKAMSRVLGYTAEPDRVYEKAAEICARLNRERASIDNPPSWLQKQFSVRKPDGMAVKRTSDDFTSAQVRAMRLKVMKEYLLPAGFIVGKDATYLRRDGDQIHAINFQGSMHGHEFTVNVGFHYAFIPPKFYERCVALPEFSLLDCVVHTRISSLLSYKTDKWFEYGRDRDSLLSSLTLCATTCLTAFQQISERWRDSAAMLSDFPDDSFSKGLNGDWRIQSDSGLAWIELKAGRLEDAESRMAEWKSRIETLRPRYVSFEKMLKQCRRQGSRSVQSVKWKNWIE